MTSPELRLAVIGARLQAGSELGERHKFADIGALLMPIDELMPAGEFLRYDPAFDALKEARRREDTTTPQGIWTRERKRADWAGVDAKATAFLSNRSKDLQVAAWLMEAWVRLHGFAGARVGTSMLVELCDRYWPDLHPLPDGDDFGARAATIEWINERLRLPLLEVHITQPTDADGRAWNWAERQEAMRREALTKRQGKNAKALPEADAWLTTPKFNASVASTPRRYLVECDEDLAASIASGRIFQQQVDQYFGVQAPSLSRIIDLQQDIRQWLATVIADKGPDVPRLSKPVDVVSASPSPAAPAAAAPSILGAVMQQTQHAPPAAVAPPRDQVAARTEAYRKLSEAADTLLLIEPHSPTPYLVKRAIVWGGMSLAELMRHFIDSGYDLKSLYSMLGMDEQENDA